MPSAVLGVYASGRIGRMGLGLRRCRVVRQRMWMMIRGMGEWETAGVTARRTWEKAVRRLYGALVP